MPITPLPPATARALLSTQSLPTPSSAIKELLDNALDARAAAVAVELVPTVLDHLVVRDNGHSVPPTDRPRVCRRGCTSKLRELAELQDVGGWNLGFRVEVMACVAEVGAQVAVSTRVEGERVGECWEYGRDGEATG